MTCAKCGGELLADRAAIAEFRAHNLVGGRIYCRMGCTSIWLQAAPIHVERHVGADHKTSRRVRRFQCSRCGAAFRSNASRVKRCARCRVLHKREVVRQYDRERKRRDRAVA